MPEDVTINDDLRIIEVYSHGSVSKENILASIASVKQITNETGIKSVLVDTTEEKTFPSAVGIINFVEQLPRYTKFAVLVSSDQVTKDDVEFAETAAYNRGFLLKIFTSKKEAIEWLTR